MVDPIVGAVVAKTVSATRRDSDQVTPGLLKSILGPPAREFGDALGRAMAYRTRNFGRILDKANERLRRKDIDGIVNIRVAYALLEEGSLCDDELMVEMACSMIRGLTQEKEDTTEDSVEDREAILRHSLLPWTYRLISHVSKMFNCQTRRVPTHRVPFPGLSASL